MSQTVVDQLRESLGSFPVTERRVAHRLLAEYPMAGLLSATDLARVVGVSTPTVLRMVGDDLPYVPLYRRTLTWAMARKVSLVQWPNDSLELRWVRVK